MRYLLKTILISTIAFGIVLAIASCMHKQTAIHETDLQKRSRFFNAYLEEIFPSYELKDGEYLFILPNGCSYCNKSTCSILTLNPSLIKGKYKAILISKSTLDKLPEKFLSIEHNILIDTTNKLDKMAFGIAGISVMKVENKQIVAKKSMTAEDYKNNPEEFFNPL